MAREVDDAQVLVELVRVRREQQAGNALMHEILNRLRRAHIGDLPEVLAPFMRADDGN